MMRTYAGHSSATDSNALYRTQPVEGPDRALGGLRPADPDRLRPRPPAGPRRGRQGRRPDPAPRRDAAAVRRHPARRDEHLDDDQRHRDVAARALPGRRRGAGGSRRARRGRIRGGARHAGRHHPERHHQGVPLPRDLRVPARALAAADHRPDRLHRQPHPEVEPDQHLQLPPAGGRRDADAGARLRPVHRDRGARHGARLRPGRPRGLRARSSAASRSSSTPACGSSRRCARCAPSSQLWDEITRERYGVEDDEDAPVPLRRPGQLAWA